MENVKNEVEKMYNKFYGNTLVRLDKKDIRLDKDSAKMDTIYAIECIINAIKHEDNRMYYEIKFWNECLIEANCL